MTTWYFNVSNGGWFDSDDWVTETNPPGNGVPGAGDTAVIDNGGVANLGATDDTIASLVLESGSLIGDATLTATAGSQLTDGYIGGSVSLDLGGTSVLQGFTIGGGADVVNKGVAEQTSGGITIGDNSGIDASFINASGATYEFANSVSVVSGASTATFVNDGTLETLAGTGTSVLSVSTVNNGAISIAGGTELAIAGSNSQIGGTISGAGALNLFGDDTLESTLSLNVGELAIGEVGTTTLAGSFTTSSTFYAAAAFSLYVGVETAIDLNGNTLTLKGSSFFETDLNSELLIGGGGILKTAGPSSFFYDDEYGGNTVIIGSGTEWINSGTVSLASNVQLGDYATASTFDNTSTGVIDFLPNFSITQGSTASSTLINAGLIENTNGSETGKISVSVVNSGKIEALVGTVVINGAITNKGTVEAAEGYEVDLFGGGTLGATIGGGNGEVVMAGLFIVGSGQTQTVTFASGAMFAAAGTNSAYFSGAGTIASKGTVAIGNNGGNSLLLEDDVIWENEGTVNDAGVVQLSVNFGDNAILDNAAGAKFDISAQGTIFQLGYGAGTIDNAGAFAKTSGTGVSDLRVAFDNTGTILANSGTLEFDGGGILGGTIGGGNGKVVLDGTFSVAAGETETVTFEFGASLAAAGTGTAYFSGAGTIASKGTVAIGNNGHAALVLEDDVIWENEGTVNDAGAVQFSDGFGDNATLDNAAGGTFDISAQGTIFQLGYGAGTIDNAGAFAKTSGTGVSDLQVAFDNTGTILAESGTLQFDDGGILGGTIGGGNGKVVLDGTFSVAAGEAETVTFASGATFAAAGTNSAYFSGAGTIASKGTVAIGNNGGNSLLLEDDVIWENEGTVNDAGVLQFSDGFGDNAILDNAAGAKFDISAQGTIFQLGYGAGTIDNAGALAKTSGTGVSDLRVAFDNTGTILANSGTLEFDGGGILGGTIGGGNGKVVLDGTFSAAAGETETVTFASGALLAAAGTGTAYFSGAGTIASKGAVAIGNNGGVGLWLEDDVIWENEGTVNDAGRLLFGVVGGDGAILDNAAGSTFDISAQGTVFQTGNSNVTATIDNAGTFDKNSGGGVADIQVAIVNNKTIASTSGILDLQDAVTGSGGIYVGEGASLELDSTVGAGQELVYVSGGGKFLLDDLDVNGANLFSGRIDSFGSGDSFDVGDFGEGTTFNFVENSNNAAGQLQLTDGSTLATINFVGHYSNENFVATYDGNGGTLFKFTT